MHTHDQSTSSEHVVAIGDCDEEYGGQVVDKHDHEILTSTQRDERIKRYLLLNNGKTVHSNTTGEVMTLYSLYRANNSITRMGNKPFGIIKAHYSN